MPDVTPVIHHLVRLIECHRSNDSAKKNCSDIICFTVFLQFTVGKQNLFSRLGLWAINGFRLHGLFSSTVLIIILSFQQSPAMFLTSFPI